MFRDFNDRHYETEETVCVDYEHGRLIRILVTIGLIFNYTNVNCRTNVSCRKYKLAVLTALNCSCLFNLFS